MYQHAFQTTGNNHITNGKWFFLFFFALLQSKQTDFVIKSIFEKKKELIEFKNDMFCLNL